jgi:SNF2 family DNA or RNA helicase
VKFIPHAYQAEAIDRLERFDHYGLFLDMGLGKTIITLTAIQNLIYDLFEVQRVLIIAPRTVAESTWQDEAGKWDHLSLRFSTVLGTAKQRIAALRMPADCYVINRENVVWLCELFKFRLPFDMVVVDESSSFKSPTAKRFRALRKSLPCFSRVVILTGTPAPNNLVDLWSQIYLLDKGAALGRSVTAYREQYFKPDKMNGHIVYSYRLRDSRAEQEIYDAIAPEVMSLKAADYLTLPPRIDNVIKISLPDKAVKAYQKMTKELVLGLGSEDEITVANAAALSNKLLQMANGRVYTDDGNIVDIHSAKIEKLAEIVEQNEGKPILVFYAYKHDLDTLMQRFPSARKLEGADEVSDWNQGKIPMLLAHPASTAYGLNLQSGGHLIVWYGLTWSLELYQQANARLHRQGQEKPVIINHLVSKGTIDEQVMRALRSKAAGQDALMEAVKAEIRKAKLHDAKTQNQDRHQP